MPRGPALCAAPRPVQSLSVLRSAFSTPLGLFPPRGLSAPNLLGGCAGHAEVGREAGSLCLPLAPAEAGALHLLRFVPVRGPAMGLSLAGPSGVSLRLGALRWFACGLARVTDASAFPYCPSFDGGLCRCTGAVSCGRQHLSLRIKGHHARVSCVSACARSSWPGRAGQPPGRVLVRLTFPLPALFFCFARPPAGGLGPSCWFVCLLMVFLPFLFSSIRAPVVFHFLWFFAPGVLGPGAVMPLPPLPPSFGPNFSHHKARVQAVGWFPLGTRKLGSRLFAAPTPPPEQKWGGTKRRPTPPRPQDALAP